ncbi:hypothetical protein PF005_g13476 [Phytophthora fragariae]|uniref:Uncharacterized protein n=1 Tax=Phytophthora fragariae TaxID=53985 RepID=A0A6A3XXZ8_9STRA|nr:hypothetical protein PF005_g13476 [Phytophthora fragariae]
MLTGSLSTYMWCEPKQDTLAVPWEETHIFKSGTIQTGKMTSGRRQLQVTGVLVSTLPDTGLSESVRLTHGCGVCGKLGFRPPEPQQLASTERSTGRR